MPQNTKDSRGGKTQRGKQTESKTSPGAGEKKTSRSAQSPTGPMNKGKKKTTP